MRSIVTSAAIFLCTIVAGAATSKVVIPTPIDARPGDIRAFYGRVVNIDRDVRTITLGMPMRFTFKVIATTAITVRHGGAANLEAIKPGAGVDVVARRDVKDWTALKITLQPGATFPEEMSARTVQGKTITGPEVASYVTYGPPAEVVNRNIDFGNRSGLFRLSLRPDGSVAAVSTIKSLGVKELDERTTARLRKMRFRPGALSEVRIPANVNSFRHY